MIIPGFRKNKLYLSIDKSSSTGTHKSAGISDSDIPSFVQQALDAEKAGPSPQPSNILFLEEWLGKQPKKPSAPINLGGQHGNSKPSQPILEHTPKGPNPTNQEIENELQKLYLSINKSSSTLKAEVQKDKKEN